MKNILMCCSDLSYKGGMVSVVRGYLESPDWGPDCRVTFIPTHRDASRAGLLVCFARAVARITLLAARGRIDMAHLHVSERGSFTRKAFLVRLLHRFGIPVVLHHHGAEFEDYYASSSPRQQRYISRILAEADVNIVLSRRLVGMITSKAPEARVEVVYNSVTPVTPNPYDAAAADRILLLGRLGHRKGAYDLLEAISRLDQMLPPEVKFSLCGDGEEAEVAARARELGIMHRIDHIGWIAGEEKERILARTMINVLPSYNEGLPMTILETMGRGIPNISTAIASIPEVITDGETGYLITPGDVDSLTDRILRFVSSPAERVSISEASHRLISKSFALPAAVARLKTIYNRLLRK